MTLWIIFGAMLLAGALFVCWPIYSAQRRLTAVSAIAAISIMIVAAGVYSVIGSPGVLSGSQSGPSVDEMVAALEQRLQNNPDDVAGWKMLGRSSMQLKNFSRAVTAFEEASQREGGGDGQTLADLGEAVLLADGERVSRRAAQLFDSALAISPDNQKALFYGGIAAIERNDPDLAADRWEALLALSPPPEIQEILKIRIAQWRGNSGETPPAAAESLALSVAVALGSEAQAAVSADTSIFVIARDPQQPSPPIAVARRQAGELPAMVILTDADAMIPGRLLSQFAELEIVVRASLSGQPIAQSGDWYGQRIVQVSEATSINIQIDQQVD